MLEKIRLHKLLAQFIETSCSENDISIQIDEKIDTWDYVILKPDKYYNSLKIEKRPPSVDCLVIQKCTCVEYKATLIELKSLHSSANFDLQNMISKFETTLTHFMTKTFRDQLFYDYKKIDLYFVSQKDIYNSKRDLGLKLDILISKKFNYNGKSYMIRPRLPIPTIKPCY